MTEGDTFNALSKPSYYEMKKVWMSSDEFTRYTVNLDRKELEMFKKYGWTVAEYTDYSCSLFIRTR